MRGGVWPAIWEKKEAISLLMIEIRIKKKFLGKKGFKGKRFWEAQSSRLYEKVCKWRKKERRKEKKPKPFFVLPRNERSKTGWCTKKYAHILVSTLQQIFSSTFLFLSSLFLLMILGMPRVPQMLLVLICGKRPAGPRSRESDVWRPPAQCEIHATPDTTFSQHSECACTPSQSSRGAHIQGQKSDGSPRCWKEDKG